MAKPRYDFEHILAPWSSFVILPLFAFANAGVSFDGIDSSVFITIIICDFFRLNYRKTTRRIWFPVIFPLN